MLRYIWLDLLSFSIFVTNTSVWRKWMCLWPADWLVSMETYSFLLTFSLTKYFTTFQSCTGMHVNSVLFYAHHEEIDWKVLSWSNLKSKNWLPTKFFWIKRLVIVTWGVFYSVRMLGITSNHRKIGVNGVWVWIFEWAYM